MGEIRRWKKINEGFATTAVLLGTAVLPFVCRTVGRRPRHVRTSRGLANARAQTEVETEAKCVTQSRFVVSALRGIPCSSVGPFSHKGYYHRTPEQCQKWSNVLLWTGFSLVGSKVTPGLPQVIQTFKFLYYSHYFMSQAALIQQVIKIPWAYRKKQFSRLLRLRRHPFVSFFKLRPRLSNNKPNSNSAMLGRINMLR